MFFLIFSNADIKFLKNKLILKFYITVEILPSIKQVELINEKKFVKVVLDKNSKIFVMQIVTLESLLL